VINRGRNTDDTAADMQNIQLQSVACELMQCVLGLCDVDKIKRSRFLDLFFDFNHDFDTNRHALQL